MKNGAKSIIVLTLICLISSGLLGGVNHLTAPIIAASELKATQNACFEVMPAGKSFEEVDIKDKNLSEKITAVYSETDGGYVFKIKTKGYDSGLVIMCGIDANGKVTGTKILSSNETPSIGGQCAKTEYSSQYTGKDSSLEDIEAISGATLTSTGYYNAIKTAFEAFETLGGNK